MSLVAAGAVDPESAGWSYVGFEVVARPPVERDTGSDEHCIVVLSGTVHVADWKDLGGRSDPWSGMPDAVYLPPGTQYLIQGEARWRSAARPPARARRRACSRARTSRSRRAATARTSARSVRSSWATRRPTRCWSARCSPRRPLVELPAAQARPRRAARASPSSRRPTTTASRRATASPSSASTRPTARSTRRSPCATATRARAARLPHGLRAARLRALLPQRHGRTHPGLGRRQRPRPRVDAD